MSECLKIRPNLCVDRPSSRGLDFARKLVGHWQVGNITALGRASSSGAWGRESMPRSAWCARIALIVFLLMMLVPDRASAQSAASISGVVKDTDGAVMPGVSVVIKNDASGASQEVTTDAEGRYQVTALGAGSVHRIGDAVGLQGRHLEEHPPRARSAGLYPAHARDWPARRDGRGHEQLGAHQHRERDRRGDAELRPAHPHADGDPQRAERGRIPARRQHDRDQPRLDHQRPA